MMVEINQYGWNGWNRGGFAQPDRGMDLFAVNRRVGPLL